MGTALIYDASWFYTDFGGFEMSEAQSTGPVLSLPVAAVRLGLSYQTTYRLAVGGKLGKPRHRRGRWYVPEKVVERYRRDNTFEVADL